MTTRVFDVIEFCEQFLKTTSYRTFPLILAQIDTAVCEMFKEIVDNAEQTMADGHSTTLKVPLEHVVFR